MRCCLAILALGGWVGAQAQQAPPETQADKVLAQHLDLAGKARQRNDTEEELTHLLPAFERALQLRSLGVIDHVASLVVDAYIKAGQPDKAVETVKRGLAAVRSIAGPESILALECAFAVVLKYDAIERNADAQALMAEVVRDVRKAAGPDSAWLQQVLTVQAALIGKSGDENKAIEILKEAEAIRERRYHKDDFGFPPDATITRLVEQGKVASWNKESAELDRLVAEVTAAAEKLDIRNPQRARVWYEVAIMYNLPPAPYADLVVKHLMKSLDLDEAGLGKEPIADLTRVTLPMVHLRQMGATLGTLTPFCSPPSGWFDCMPLYEHSIAVHERALGQNHPAVGNLLGQFSSYLYATAKEQQREVRHNSGTRNPHFAQAIKHRERELSIYEHAFGKDDPWLADIVRKLADIYTALGDDAVARPLYARALKLDKAERLPQTGEDVVRYEVRQLRLLLRFEDADEKAELYLTHHPGSMLKFEQVQPTNDSRATVPVTLPPLGFLFDLPRSAARL